MGQSLALKHTLILIRLLASLISVYSISQVRMMDSVDRIDMHGESLKRFMESIGDVSISLKNYYQFLLI